MEQITVYFAGDKRALFDRDKVSFRDGDTFFTLSDADGDGEAKRYPELLNDGRALVNWENVCFVQAYEALGEADD